MFFGAKLSREVTWGDKRSHFSRFSKSNVLTTLIIGVIMGNKRFDTWLIQIIGPIYDPQSVFFRTEKKAFYANWIGFTNLKSVWTGKKSVFCNPVLPYPIPSYQIPSLPHPTRILNTILHLYKILLPYTTLSYHIEIELNRPRPKRLGSVHHQNLPRPKSPGRNDPNSVVCTAKMLKSFGLVYSPILRLKNFFFCREFTGKSEAVHTPLKCKQSRYASKQDIIGYQENVLRTWYAHFQK